uniref:Uncharacterized protein n=1 Tax=Percolomonas cosmopolitus TaxID=63605 RepID=A0A7S1PFV6_9EUKA
MHIKEQRGQGLFGSSTLYFYLHNTLCVGWMFLMENSEPQGLHISLCNMDTFLNPEMLFLGESSKRNDEKMGGSWGEGGKTEANRLCAVGGDHSVIYHSGHHKWKFFHQKDKYFTVEFEQCHHLPYTVMHIDAPPTAFAKSDFLFLHTHVDRIVVPKHTMQLILSPQHVGCVFTHGILVCRDRKAFPSFGINWTGNISKEMGIGRDRFNIDRRFMATHVILSIIEMEQLGILRTSKHGKKLLGKLLLEFKQRRGEVQSVIQYANFSVHKHATPWNWELFGTVMLKALEAHEGNSCILPFDRDSAPDLEEEAEMFGLTGVALSAHFVSLLQQSPHCAQIEKLRQQYFSDYMRLPEGRPLLEEDEAEKHSYLEHSARFGVSSIHWWNQKDKAGYLAQHLLNFVSSVLYPIQVPSLRQIKFKDFSNIQSNTQPIVFLVDPKDNCEYFLVDWQSFYPDRVHAELLRDEDFHCSGKNCGCVFLKFWDNVMKILEVRKGVPSKSLQTLNRRMINLLFGSVNQLEVTPSNQIQPAKRTQRGVTTEDSGPMDGEETDFTTTGRRRRHHHMSNHPLNQHITFSVQRVLHTTIHRDEPELPINDTGGILNDWTCEAPERTAIQLVGASIRGVPVHIDVRHHSLFEEAQTFLTNNSQIVELAALIVEVLARLFDLHNTQSHQIFHLFYQKNTGVVAFNVYSQKEMYFNIAAFQEWLCVDGRPVEKSAHRSEEWHHLIAQRSLQQCLSFWMIVFCHELAHNQHHGHNRAHEELEESLCAFGMPILYRNVFLRLDELGVDGDVSLWGEALKSLLE